MDNITFNGIRESLIEYYSKQDIFRDYNFSAPAISTLIDGMAYLGYLCTTYANFALNESFLDTAIKRSSVVSKARNIGYTPSQFISSKASLMLNYLGSSNLDNYTIPVGTTFTAINNGTTYYFRSYEPAIVQKTSSGRYYAQVRVREGTMVTNRWTMASDMTTRFVLSDPRVDLSTLEVKVYSSSTDRIGTQFREVEGLGDFAPDANVYTVEENTDGNVELIFGDGTIATLILPGQIVECTYLSCSGEIANNIATFQLTSIPGSGHDYTLWTVSTLEISNSGADRETIESIKLNAPRFFQRQGRNVVADDYKADVMSEFGSIIDAISVWGGENNTPPEYGSVFISVKPKDALTLSTAQKEDILAHIEESSVIGITPKIVDAEILYVNMIIDVTYDKLFLKMTPDALTDAVVDATNYYFNNSVSSFNVDFKYSKFLTSIFNLSDSISDVVGTITLYQYFLPNTGIRASYVIDFKNAIEPGTVSVGPYLVTGQAAQLLYMDDSLKDGVLREVNGDTVTEVGTVDYENGTVTIENFTFSTTVGEQIPVTMQPASKNMSVTQNYVFSINSVDVQLTAEDPTPD